MNAPELVDAVRRLLAGDKGLLAMDESNPTCDKRARRGVGGHDPQAQYGASGRRGEHDLEMERQEE
jgi:fructose-bisphosphate aldolase class I